MVSHVTWKHFSGSISIKSAQVFLDLCISLSRHMAAGCVMSSVNLIDFCLVLKQDAGQRPSKYRLKSVLLVVTLVLVL